MRRISPKGGTCAPRLITTPGSTGRRWPIWSVRLKLNPNNYQAIYGLGTIFESLGDAENAYRAYMLAQAIHPHYESVTEALDRLKPEVEGKAL